MTIAMSSGAVGGIPTPAQILGASLLAWHRNGDWIASGGLISQWNDSSAAARHVTAAGTLRPAETAAVFGALPGATLAAGSTFMSESGAMLSGNAAHTIFVMAKQAALPNAGGWATVGTDATSARGTSTVGVWSAGQRWYAGDDDLSGLVAGADTTARLYGKTYNGSAYAPRRSGADDGAPFAAGGALNLSAGHMIGSFNATSGTPNGAVGEVVIASGVATAGQIAALEAYFLSVFGAL